jgi:hypothetical protein
MTRTYLVECYWPGVSEARLADAVARLAVGLDDSEHVRWLDSILVPVDETVLWLFRGATAAAVHNTAHQAGLSAERIVECVQIATNERDRSQGRGIR